MMRQHHGLCKHRWALFMELWPHLLLSDELLKKLRQQIRSLLCFDERAECAGGAADRRHLQLQGPL